MKEKIEALGVVEYYLTVDVKDKEAFTLSRKSTFGGSDSAALLGVAYKKTVEELRIEKSNKTITSEEIAVGELPQVRKGSDLEPFILSKAEEKLGKEILKPKETFKFKEFPFLAMNFDGIVEEETLIPVEAKLVTQYGEKYYKKEITIEEQKKIDMKRESEDMEVHIKLKANKYGIPAYYYTQVQQEIMALDAPYGYLMAWFDATWSGKLYLIKKDEYVQRAIVRKAEENKDCL